MLHHITHVYIIMQHPANYKFDWAVKDDYYNDYGQHESRVKDNTQGSYWVLMPDGRKRVVDYKVDAYGGFEIIDHRIEGQKYEGYTRPSYNYKPRDYKKSTY